MGFEIGGCGVYFLSWKLPTEHCANTFSHVLTPLTDLLSVYYDLGGLQSAKLFLISLHAIGL